MSIFKRLFRVVQSESHALVDHLEDPIKMTEQGIRDLKKDLRDAMTSLAQVKSIALRMKREADDKQKLGSDYERKAMMLLQKMQSGSIDAGDAERLATEALSKKEECDNQNKSILAEQSRHQTMSDQLQQKVNVLKQTITKYDNELITLKARAKTASSMRKINQQLANVDSTGTIAMLEKMKNKVEEEESLAQAYGEIADSGVSSVDAEIDKALAAPATQSDSLAALKAKMGLS